MPRYNNFQIGLLVFFSHEKKVLYILRSLITSEMYTFTDPIRAVANISCQASTCWQKVGTFRFTLAKFETDFFNVEIFTDFL